MVRHALKILQHLLQDFLSVADPFGRFCIIGFIYVAVKVINTCITSDSLLNFVKTWSSKNSTNCVAVSLKYSIFNHNTCA